MNLFHAIHTQKAMRRLAPDPVADELVWQILDAAICAPNGSNKQPWNFIVVRDPEIKRELQVLYAKGAATVTRPGGENPDPRLLRSGAHLLEHLAEAPVLIVATVRLADVASVTPPGACIYPALQNLMLAARALGLGTTLTTAHRGCEAEVKKLLGVPEDVETMALVPVGWPRGRFGPPPRRPAEEVTFWDRWGEERERATSADPTPGRRSA